MYIADSKAEAQAIMDALSEVGKDSRAVKLVDCWLVLIA